MFCPYLCMIEPCCLPAAAFQYPAGSRRIISHFSGHHIAVINQLLNQTQHLFFRNIVLQQNLRRKTVHRTNQSQHQMLGSDIGVMEFFRYISGIFYCPFRLSCQTILHNQPPVCLSPGSFPQGKLRIMSHHSRLCPDA